MIVQTIIQDFLGGSSCEYAHELSGHCAPEGGRGRPQSAETNRCQPAINQTLTQAHYCL